MVQDLPALSYLQNKGLLQMSNWTWHGMAWQDGIYRIRIIQTLLSELQSSSFFKLLDKVDILVLQVRFVAAMSAHRSSWAAWTAQLRYRWVRGTKPHGSFGWTLAQSICIGHSTPSCTKNNDQPTLNSYIDIKTEKIGLTIRFRAPAQITPEKDDFDVAIGINYGVSSSSSSSNLHVIPKRVKGLGLRHPCHFLRWSHYFEKLRKSNQQLMRVCTDTSMVSADSNRTYA